MILEVATLDNDKTDLAQPRIKNEIFGVRINGGGNGSCRGNGSPLMVKNTSTGEEWERGCIANARVCASEEYVIVVRKTLQIVYHIAR